MRRMAGIAIAVIGTFSSVIIINILLCVWMPEYHDALVSVISRDIKTTVIEDEKMPLDSSPGMNEKDATTYEPKVYEVNDKEHLENVEEIKEEIDTDDSKEKKPEIVDKTYHEDCGTGKGYWVITYSDGSVEVE